MKKHPFLISMIAVLAIAVTAFSAGPNLMSYQGQVLTAGGVPVANGSYPAKFEFFSAAVAGSSLWSETGSITTSSGLFTHTLGSITAIPTSVFVSNPNVWLEVTVNGQLQTPRTQLTSASNSITTGTVDGAMGGTITSSTKIDGTLTLGTPSVTNGGMTLNSSSSGFQTGALYEYGGQGGALDLFEESGFPYAGLEPDFDGTGGYFFVRNGAIGSALAVDGSFSGGWPLISLNGFTSVYFDLSTIANNSVQLPDSAISAPEILDEPGVASNNSFASVAPLTATMQDLTTLTITIPAPGYIWLTGKIREVDLYSPGASSLIMAQIDETAGGSWIDPHVSIFGGTPQPTSGYFPVSLDCQRMYYKSSAGSYTFRLEVMDFFAGGASGAYYPTLTAIYFSTSYGSVATLVSSAEVGDFQSAKLTSASGPAPASGAVAADMYSVDLRELELKVAKTEADAQKARAALAEARLKEQLNAKQSSSVDKK